jgi:hypothetical protein
MRGRITEMPALDGYSNIVRYNRFAICGLAIYGLATDEPYWRQNGHGPNLFDYCFWTLLALNGPSGLIADFGPRYLPGASQIEWHFVMQYSLWCVLVGPQWMAYRAFKAWSTQGRWHMNGFWAITLGLVSIGAISAYMASVAAINRVATNVFWIPYYWEVRYSSIACAGLVLLAYQAICKKSTSSMN